VPIFSCQADGIYADDYDCHSYFECLWVGTPLERQEHVRCQSELIFNPLKLRCDTAYDYRNHLLSHGIRTKHDLIQLIRFSNCIGHNLLQNITRHNNSTTKLLPTIVSTTSTTTPPDRNFRRIESNKNDSYLAQKAINEHEPSPSVSKEVKEKHEKNRGVFRVINSHAAKKMRPRQGLDQSIENLLRKRLMIATKLKHQDEISHNSSQATNSSDSDELKWIIQNSMPSMEIAKKSKVNQENAYQVRKLLSVDDEESSHKTDISALEKKIEKKLQVLESKKFPKVRSFSKKYEHLKEVLNKAKKKNIERKNRELSSFTTKSAEKNNSTKTPDTARPSSSTKETTTFFIRLNTTVNPQLQTYKINQTKKLFGSLKMDSVRGDLVSENFTKINEVERGGKFQRLRLAPTDTLIECKENDFGLECSCSIT
jgi:hypothetical protein